MNVRDKQESTKDEKGNVEDCIISVNKCKGRRVRE